MFVKISPVRISRALLIIVLLLFLVIQVRFFKVFPNDVSIKSWTQPSNSKLFIDQDNYIPPVYETLIERHGQGFQNLKLSSKCKAYFHSLYQFDASWEISANLDDLPYDRNVFEREKEQYVRDRIQGYFHDLELKRQKESGEKTEITEKEKNEIIEKEGLRGVYALELQKNMAESLILEQKLQESNTHLRAYGACFLNQYDDQIVKVSKGDKDADYLNYCFDAETRLFPWLSKKLPRYTRFDGQVLYTFPKMKDYIPDQPEAPISSKSKHYSNSNCFLESFRNNLNGKGFAVSSADKYVEQIVQLVAHLRALNNKLPIQIVHYGDELSSHSIRKIIKAARSLDINSTYIEYLPEMLKTRNMTGYTENKQLTEDQVEKLFPPQEVWFVDVSQSITPKYREKYGGYGNKLLAYLFNSFQHSMLIDTDTVPMVDFDENILNSPQYLQKGAFFFRDRETAAYLSGTDLRFYRGLMPSLIDTAIFNVPRVTDHILRNRFMEFGFVHYMESGVVAIDKFKHFTAVLNTLQVQIWNAVTKSLWGDKELFWLAMGMVGDEDYYMNKLPAGSLGVMTPKEFRLPGDGDSSRRNKLISNEVCSAHPGHVAPDNTTLLWFNGGFSWCKFSSEPNQAKIDSQYSLFTTWLSTEEKVKELYTKSFQHFNAIIIPKHAEYFAANDLGEPARGWDINDVCRGFVWCAYDKIGGRDSEETNGRLIQFTSKQLKRYYFLGSVNYFAFDIFKVSKE